MKENDFECMIQCAHGAYLPDDETNTAKAITDYDSVLWEPLVLQLKENIELRIGLYTKSSILTYLPALKVRQSSGRCLPRSVCRTRSSSLNETIESRSQLTCPA